VSRDHRKKASEVFSQTSYVFSEKVPFAAAFPEIESVRFQYELRGDGVYKWNATGVRDRVGEYIDCVNPICYNGGFSIGSLLRDMVGARETHREGIATCQGNEGSPKGRRVYRKCLNHWTYVIDLTYKPAAPTP